MKSRELRNVPTVTQCTPEKANASVRPHPWHVSPWGWGLFGRTGVGRPTAGNGVLNDTPVDCSQRMMGWVSVTRWKRPILMLIPRGLRQVTITLWFHCFPSSESGSESNSFGSPESLKSQIKSRVRERRDHLSESIRQVFSTNKGHGWFWELWGKWKSQPSW